MPPDPFADRYTDLQLLGRGGFGEVYRARDSVMERPVALKLLKPELALDPDWRRRFRLEATRNLLHPNITINFDVGEYQGQPFIVMELIEGEPLSKIIDQKLPLTDPERLSLLEQLCEGLQYAHRLKVVHRDIKPGNLMVCEQRQEDQIVRTLKILDFGIARVVTDDTSTGSFMFSPSYVSPEQVKGQQADERSDMFAVGAVAYELLSYTKAFDVKAKNLFEILDEVRKHADEPHRPLLEVRPDLDPELSQIVDRALAKRPSDRFKNLGEMSRRLRKVRERLEEPAGDDARPTIVLSSGVQSTVQEAREALEADEPTAAISKLELALSSHPTRVERRFLEQILEEARERQHLHRVARRAREQAAAFSAIEWAKTAFATGDRGAAIDHLAGFEPADLVEDELKRLRTANVVLGEAERLVSAAASEAERVAAIAALDRHSSNELVASGLERLRTLAEARRVAEAEARKVADAARIAFVKGQRDTAIATVAALEPFAFVTAALYELRNAAAVIHRTALEVRGGPADARAQALIALETYEPPDLVVHALEELRVVAAARDASDQQKRLEAANTRAMRAMAVARASFVAGDREGALAELLRFEDQPRVTQCVEQLQHAATAITVAAGVVRSGPAPARTAALATLAEFPDRELVAAALIELRDLDQARTTEETIGKLAAVARARFVAGDRNAALLELEQVKTHPSAARVLTELRVADAAIRDAEGVVERADAANRDAAVEALAAFEPPELVGAALKVLRVRNAERAREERDQADAEQRAAWAQAAEIAVEHARQRFASGNYAEAISDLKTFAKREFVQSGLAELQRLAMLIETTATRIRTGAPGDRAEALVELEQAGESVLLAAAVDQLRQLDRDRTADEQLEEERRHARLRAEAETVRREAFAAFAAGDRVGALNRLDAFVAQDLILAASEVLREANTAIERLRAVVAGSARDNRAAALRELSRLNPPALFVHALSELQQIDRDRSAEENRAAAAAAAKAAVERFEAGDYTGSVADLAEFQPKELVGTTLDLLRSARASIERVRAIVSIAPDAEREQAIAQLREFDAPRLVARAADELEKEHLRHRARADEERLQRESDAAAAAVIDKARALFRRSQTSDALALLEGAPPHPMVAAALTELRIEVRLAELVSGAQSQLADGNMAVASSLIAEALRLRPDDPTLLALEDLIQSHKRRIMLQRLRRGGLRAGVPLLLVVGVGIATYTWWPSSPPPGAGIPPSATTPKADPTVALRQEIMDLWAQGNGEDAVIKLEQALRQHPQEQELVAVRQRFVVEAQTLAESARRRAEDGATGDALFGSAQAEEARAGREAAAGRPFEGIRAYWKAARNYDAALKNAGPVAEVEAFLKSGDRVKALDALTIGLKASPSNVRLRKQLDGLRQDALAKVAAAEQSVGRSKDFDDSAPDYRAVAQDYRAARAATGPDSVRTLWSLIGRFETAEKKMSAAAALRARGIAAARGAQHSEALAILRDAQSQFPGFKATRTLAQELRGQAGQDAGAARKAAVGAGATAEKSVVFAEASQIERTALRGGPEEPTIGRLWEAARLYSLAEKEALKPSPAAPANPITPPSATPSGPPPPSASPSSGDRTGGTPPSEGARGGSPSGTRSGGSEAPLDYGGVNDAIERYREAWRTMDLELLLRVYPTFKRKEVVTENRRNCQSSPVDIADKPNITFGLDGTATARFTAVYSCIRRGKRESPATFNEIFVLSRQGDRWIIIDTAGS